ncbi:MAG: DUF5340 domain-containing protein [Cyanobacteria bacterium P01_F01_bin.150]
MDPIPLPSHIHYELLLQLLEQQTLFAVGQNLEQRRQVQELIGTLRKALTQQKRLEEDCGRQQFPIEYRWSLNDELSLGKPELTMSDNDSSDTKSA